MILGQALSYKTNRFLKSNINLRESIPYTQAQNFGILFSNSTPEKGKIAEQLSTLLKGDSKKVKVLAYDRNVEIKHLPFESFSKKDLNFWGNIISQSVQNFSNVSFDFLICLDHNPGEIIKNLLAKSKAKCRVGVCSNSEAYHKTFELIIQTENDLNTVDSVYSYTKNIR
ncbi:MAG: hypothetical protein L3J29_10590 [Cyclobacteriaceae bacterium]|nr:hypothetical protein [Cyclobacteriaceae bacterium]